ncbi:MAG: sugar transferase, partial [Bacteroidales bacterium]|nr:sugar transferase [Bacteroidales bacterium]
VKRILDIIGSVVGMAVLAVASVFIIPAIKLESKGPVLFKQKRVGQNGRVFYLYKFRSMYDSADLKKKELIKQNKIKNDYMFKMEHDPRVTKVGAFLRKTSPDELPQFINVFKGDMSLVGTRPPTLDEVVKYNNPHHRRISFKPGITGMWQISGRSDITDFDEVVRLDTSYIDDWNIWKDIVIIFKTIYVLLFKNKGAY